MAKAKKARYSGVAVYVDGQILSRVQSLSAGVDLSTENLNELSNSSIVEVKEGLPATSISIDTNEFGGLNNIWALASRKSVGGIVHYPTLNRAVIDHNSFDGTSVDLAIQVEEDVVLARTAYIGDAFVSSISWNFDVGGAATENFTLEADNKTWYLNSRKEVFSFFAHKKDYNALIISGLRFSDITGSASVVPSGLRVSKANEDFTVEPYNIKFQDDAALNAVLVSGIGTQFGAIGTGVEDSVRYRVVLYNPSARTNIKTTGFGDTFDGLSANGIGGVNKGQIQIYLISGGTLYSNPSSTGATGTLDDEVLRLQTCSIDVDLGREALEELGNFKSYDRSLTFPVPVTVTFSAIASDLEEWASLANQKWYNGTGGTFQNDALWTTNVTQFIRSASLVIFIYDDDEGAVSRTLLKKIVVRQLRVTNESFDVDQGANATQDFTCTSDNFLVSGGFYV